MVDIYSHLLREHLCPDDRYARFAVRPARRSTRLGVKRFPSPFRSFWLCAKPMCRPSVSASVFRFSVFRIASPCRTLGSTTKHLWASAHGRLMARSRPPPATAARAVISGTSMVPLVSVSVISAHRNYSRGRHFYTELDLFATRRRERAHRTCRRAVHAPSFARTIIVIRVRSLTFPCLCCVADGEEELSWMLHILDASLGKFKLKMNSNKTNIMVISYNKYKNNTQQ